MSQLLLLMLQDLRYLFCGLLSVPATLRVPWPVRLPENTALLFHPCCFRRHCLALPPPRPVLTLHLLLLRLLLLCLLSTPTGV